MVKLYSKEEKKVVVCSELREERDRATFNPDDLAEVIYGGKEALRRRRQISNMVAREPDFVIHTPLVFLQREKQIEETAKKTRAMVSHARNIIDMNNTDEMQHLINEVIGLDGYPLGLHYIMFLPGLRAQAHKELLTEFMHRAERLEIIGTYAQTEMGHGTNLRDLETTATFDRETDEFELHTPTKKASKWWPGNLGKISNYAIVCAQLFIDGKCYGPHNFLVQLREETTHEPLKGITLGDCGPKMDNNVIDNGFLSLDHVRIPRTRMLMKHSQVSKSGEYTRPIHAKLNYATMLHVRATLTTVHTLYLARAMTIAVRYSCVRRQGRIDPSKGEVKVLDYQTQQYRLLPHLARVFAFFFAGREILSINEQYTKGVEKGNTDLLPDLHSLAAGLKAVVTHLSAHGIDQCRMACGGHGYSLASGLPQLYGIQVAGCTYEGENMVMLQQTARNLVKAVRVSREGKSLSKYVDYIGNAGKQRSEISESSDSLETLLSALEHSAQRVATAAEEMLAKHERGGMSEAVAWNHCTVEMNRAARLHTRFFIAQVFHKQVCASPISIRGVLMDLLSLYLHYECLELSAHILEDEFMNDLQMKLIKARLYRDLKKVRMNAVALVDAFNFSDRELNSVLGRDDGNVYDALYEWARSSELNYTEVLPAYSQYLQPLIEENRERSKM